MNGIDVPGIVLQLTERSKCNKLLVMEGHREEEEREEEEEEEEGEE